ncbi:DUF4238 domain-containing protein [Tardiphaga sp. 538_B7_N1_4]|uniref:DUF4238 domain-containing protein n=1 Tax=Tardiphaga sp. 538_B7_N1_4 TaxID=3240778 RepID=UPI003F1F4B3E
MVQNDPSKHHYIPVFYLRQWTRNGFLCAMRKVYGGRVVALPKAPDGTGYLKDLYKIDGVPRDAAQHMEKVFLKMVDGDAADALKLLKSGMTDAWPVRERDGWVRFILSLLFRNPESVNIIKLHFRAVWDQGMASLQVDYDKTLGPDDPKTFEEYYLKANPYAAAVAASNFMQIIMNSEVIGNAIAQMKWARIHLHRSRFDLLTSDRPIDMPIVLERKDAYILLPIGPKEVFIAANDDGYQKDILKADHSEVVRKLNERTVSQARQFVWGVDDRALAFVRKHMSKLPDRVIITDKAREQSLKEARGEIAPGATMPPALEPSPQP